MKNCFPIVTCIVIVLITACAPRKNSNIATGTDNSVAIAFPGAEGFGKYTTGGRGGKVFVVSNLNDDGPGSFRDAVEATVPRIVVFSVSGTIHLLSRLNIKGDVTIAGQTAPGDGICLADYPVSLTGDNIIVRYIRCRMGDKNQNGGMVNGAGADDAFGGTRRKNIIVDHCSMSWSTDEVFSVYAGDSTTVQWNLIAEPLNYSYHFETGDKDFEHHGFGGILGGRHISIHHNLYAHCVSRTPRFDGNRNIGKETENADYRNNVIYNWGSNNVYGGEGGNYNIVNNYYKPGPATHKNASNRILNPYRRLPALPFGKFFVSGNFIEGSPAVSSNNWLGVIMNDGTVEDAEKSKMSTAFPNQNIPTQSAGEAFRDILKSVGASFRRDTLDERIIKDVRNGTGRMVDVQGGYVHGTPYSATQKAWPALQSLTPPTDTDADGMPDTFEKANGLNITANDANGHKLSPVFDNIEVYANSLLNTGAR